ncbi:flavin reductase (NADPH)-like [Styela clava]
MSNVKRIIVFGASGQTGLKILKTALEEGLGVTAYVRTPSKISENIRNRLYKVVKGEVKDKEIIEDAIQGHDAVLSALGGTSRNIISTGIANIIGGMKKHNVRNLIVVSGAILLPSEAGILSTLVKTFVKATDDHIKQIEILENSSVDIDWVAIMPPWIKDNDDVNPNYQYAKDKVPGVSRVTTAEIADFMIHLVMNKAKAESFKHCKVGISSKSK